MADPRLTPPTAPITQEGFLADRLGFWDRVTGATLKVAVAVIFFCGWLWWCAFAGFTFLHVAVLPITVALIFMFL